MGAAAELPGAFPDLIALFSKMTILPQLDTRQPPFPPFFIDFPFNYIEHIAEEPMLWSYPALGSKRQEIALSSLGAAARSSCAAIASCSGKPSHKGLIFL